ncbi:hypothetical protein CfE428DRAFT_6400 [Chthoniobacter flavus Ellin428]|uniref:Uncharacterized protein n=1 Tax=Chthoniobacter flavus Ellin428 TaxID=497964 RepID=B4DBV9_9BACT|nr:hypothetical protein CfE428DRAFT_6400 [Chthoniobacter flavus Ellin428]TCO83856.1 hypothetical protein EV701_14012 [Chthoniobacter flavus]
MARLGALGVVTCSPITQTILRFLLCVFAVAFTSQLALCADPKDKAKPMPNPIDVGWVRLLADPAAFDGKLIDIRGWLSVYLAKEYTAFRLYMSEEALTYQEMTLGLDVDDKSLQQLLPEPREVWQDFNHERVWIRGVFHYKPQTPEEPDSWPGTLDHIQIIKQTKPGSIMWGLPSSAK